MLLERATGGKREVREGGGEREKRREEKRREKKHVSVASRMCPDQGLNPKPRYVS